MQLRKSLLLSRNTAPVFAAEGAVWGAFAAYAPDIKAQINASDAQFGWVLLAGAVGAVTAMWLAPRFDRATGRWGMTLAALGLGLAMQFPLMFTQIGLFALFMVMLGAFSGLLDVVMNARLSLIESRSNMPLMNLNHAIFAFGYAISAICAGLARDGGVSVNTTAIGVLIAVTIMAFMALETTSTTTGSDTDPGGKPALGGAVFWGGLIVFSAFLAENSVEGWSALHIERTLGGGAAEGALGPAMLGLTMGFGRFMGQVIVTKFSEAVVVRWAAILAAIGALVAAAAPSPAFAYVGFGALGLGVSVIAPMVFALVGRRVPDEIRAVAISRVAVIGYFGFFVGPPVVGFLAEFIGLRFSFVFVAVILANIVWLLAIVRRDPRID